MRQIANKIFHDLQRQNHLLGRMVEFFQETHTIELRASEAAIAFRPHRGPDAQNRLINWRVQEFASWAKLLDEGKLDHWIWGTAFGKSIHLWASAMKWPPKQSLDVVIVILLLKLQLSHFNSPVPWLSVSPVRLRKFDLTHCRTDFNFDF